MLHTIYPFLLFYNCKFSCQNLTSELGHPPQHCFLRPKHYLGSKSPWKRPPIHPSKTRMWLHLGLPWPDVLLESELICLFTNWLYTQNMGNYSNKTQEIPSLTFQSHFLYIWQEKIKKKTSLSLHFGLESLILQVSCKIFIWIEEFKTF